MVRRYQIPSLSLYIFHIPPYIVISIAKHIHDKYHTLRMTRMS